jgi:hypothetical protein
MSRPAVPAFTHADNNGLICVRGHESGRAAKSTQPPLAHTLHLDFIVQFCEMGRTHYCLRCGNVPCSGCRRHSRRRRFGADCIACVHLVQRPGACGAVGGSCIMSSINQFLALQMQIYCSAVNASEVLKNYFQSVNSNANLLFFVFHLAS